LRSWTDVGSFSNVVMVTPVAGKSQIFNTFKGYELVVGLWKYMSRKVDYYAEQVTRPLCLALVMRSCFIHCHFSM